MPFPSTPKIPTPTGSETHWGTTSKGKYEVRLSQLEIKIDNLVERVNADKEAAKDARKWIVGTIIGAAGLLITAASLVYNFLKDQNNFSRESTLLFFQQLTQMRQEIYQTQRNQYFLPSSPDRH